MSARIENGWDAETYDNVSTIQQEFGLKLIQLRNWTGNEIVIDAGCGSGRVTQTLSKKILNGRIYAVDKDTNMIDKAKDNLANSENVSIIHSDLLDLNLNHIGSKADVIFSNAVLHWIPDHPRLFKAFHELLNDNGRLLIQCGGYGNLKNAISIFDKVKESKKFKDYFTNRKEEWYFAKSEDTERLLKEIGYKNIKAYLSKAPVSFDSRSNYSLYIKTVVLGPYLRCIASGKGKEGYLESVLKEIEHNNVDMMWKLDYVRLNILAYR